MANIGPPDKRRRMGNGGVPGAPLGPPRTSQELPLPSVTDDDWGALDDDFELTEGQLEELDMMASQAIAAPSNKPTIDNSSKLQHNFAKPSTSTNTSKNAALPKCKVQSNVPFYSSFDDRNKVRSTGIVNSTTVSGTSNARTHSNVKTNVEPAIMDMEMKRISAENEQCKSEISALKESDCVRDGEIQMLRQTLKQKESEVFKQKQRQAVVLDQQAKDHIQKQKDLEHELEKLRAQIKFKDQEINEFSGSVKRLEQRLKTSVSITALSASNAAPTSARPAALTSPKIDRGHRPPPTHASKATNSAFPTAHTFTGKLPSPQKVKVTVTTTVQTDPLPMPMENSRLKVGKDSLPKRCILKPIKNRSCTMTGPLLVNNLQNECETGIYQLLDRFQSLTRTVGMVTDPELRYKTEAGLAGLLSKTGDTTTIQVKPLQSDTKDAVQILPFLTHVITQKQQFENEDKSPKNRKKGNKKSEQSKNDVCYHDCLRSSLDILSCLVSYSSDVRDAILEHVTPTRDVKDEAVPVAGPSGEASECTLAMPLLEKLTALLAQTVSQQASEESLEVERKCLTILECLASQSATTQLDSFHPLVQSGVLSDILTACVERLDVLLVVVKLVRSLSQSNKLLTSLCKQSDKCTFYCLYTALQVSSASSDTDRVVALCEEMVAVTSTIVGRHRGSVTFLKEVDCPCSEELPKTVAILLHHVMSIHIEKRVPTTERTLRKGLMLAYMLSVRGISPEHFSEVELPYISFINGMKRLISSIPDATENEMLAVKYLWDFDDDSGHEENSPNKMDCDKREVT